MSKLADDTWTLIPLLWNIIYEIKISKQFDIIICSQVRFMKDKYICQRKALVKINAIKLLNDLDLWH